MQNIYKKIKKQLSQHNDIDNVKLQELADDIIKTYNYLATLNRAAGGDRKIRQISELNPGLVALVLGHFFEFKVVHYTGNIEDNNGILMFYQEHEGIYSANTQKLDNIITQLRFGDISKKFIDNVYTSIIATSEHVHPLEDSNLIAVNNGIWKRQEQKLEEFSSERIIVSKSPVNFNPKASNVTIQNPDGTTWDIESWIADLARTEDGDDPDMTELLWEIISASIRPLNAWNKAVWLVNSAGNNGKGTYLELIRNLVGDGNYATLNVAQFSGRFELGNLIGTSCTLADENDVNTYIDSSANYKSAVTGDKLSIEVKYQQPIQYRYQGLIIQCMNGFPKTRDKSNSFYRRLLAVPFDRNFQGSEKKYIKSDYIKRQEVLEYVLKRILQMDFDELSEPERCLELKCEYKTDNSPLRTFWNEMKEEFVWDLLPTKFVYDLYVSYLNRFDPHARVLSSRDFTKELKKIVAEDGDWEFKEKVHSSGKMDNPEYLIIEYNLTKWMKEDYTGTAPEKKVSFSKKSQYSGFIRI